MEYYLDLSKNQIADVTPLALLTDLMVLRLEDNLIADVTPLSRLTAKGVSVTY